MATRDTQRAVYLVTTRYSSNKLFDSENRTDNNAYKPSKDQELIDDKFLRNILLLKGGFFDSLWSFMSREGMLDIKKPIIEYVTSQLSPKWPLESISDWWGFCLDNPSSDMGEIADMALRLDSKLDVSDKIIYKQLLTGFIRIEFDDAILLITHNWYTSGIFSSFKYDNATKYIFLENLIQIAAAKENVDPSAIKLFLHDKDIINSDENKDEPLREFVIPKESQGACPALCEAVARGRVRLFIHDSGKAQPSFYKNVLNQGEPICKSVLEGYFNNRIPPRISIVSEKYIIIDISKIQDEGENSCSTTEIINAIIEFQLGDEFKLNAVKQNDQYEAVLKELPKNLPILVKGDKSLEVLQGEDGRALYLDSSIWIRYAQSESAVQDIEIFFAEYQKKSTYDTANALEVREFRARLAKNSFLRPFSGGHHGDVIPFVFHSEAEMKKAADEPLRGVKSKIWKRLKTQKLEWRILVIDDNAFITDSTKVKSVNKCNVIASILNRDFTVHCDNHTQQKRDKCGCVKIGVKCPYKLYSEKATDEKNYYPNIYIDCAQTINEAEGKIKHSRYDIILLDYLFKEKNVFSEYGTKLLRTLKKQYEDNIYRKDLLPEEADDLELYKQAKGPLGKLWIFFVSAFSNAISEQMLSDGMHYNTEYWNVARGACPTTTPELFRYNLLSLIGRQLKYITEVGGDDGKLNAVTLIDYLDYLFEESENVRMKALAHFNSLLHIRARYDILKRDYYMGGKEKGKEAEANGSPLVQALFTDMDCYSNAFWEHIQHLIYLIAYGNILQWNEMWDEYIFVKENLKSAETATGLKDICKNIEKYIINIKSANFK